MDKGLLLISGLDSILAGMLLKEQNVSFKVIYFHIPFCPCRPGQSCKITEQLSDTTRRLFNQELNVVEIGREFMELLKNAKHGFGKNINPCIDCKIFMFKRAKALLKNYDARYIITGEVLGERPMSQNRRALDLIEQDSGLRGLILRPLSAKLLPLSSPEENGWVDRERLFAIQGRSRKEQIKLAQKYGILEYPTPAGGCLLTDAGFSARVIDLLKHNSSASIEEIHLLKLGRHFRITDRLKLIVGRDEQENTALASLADKIEAVRIEPVSISGPLALAVGSDISDNVYLMAEITASHCKKGLAGNIKLEVSYGSKKEYIDLEPKNRENYLALRL